MRWKIETDTKGGGGGGGGGGWGGQSNGLDLAMSGVRIPVLV